MSAASEQLKEAKKEILEKYGKRSNFHGFMQVATTVIPYFALFYIAIECLKMGPAYYPVSIVATAILILYLMRVFMLMHDCGHEALLDSPRLNKYVGFAMGVLCGIPGYVWSQHHAYHHAVNGNWAKYRGPLNVLSVKEFSELNPKQQQKYINARKLYMAPLGGFMYFIFNPRFTWLKGTIDFALFFLSTKINDSSVSNKEIQEKFETRYWATWKEWRHMTGNNIVLITGCVLAGHYLGWAPFLIVYITAITLSGALGIVLFTVQHNFEHSYATGDEGWDYHEAAIEGTSYLDLPQFLHWFSADIGYHHLHHMSSRIPNYRLAKCHYEYEHLFDDVKRIKLSEVPAAMKFILWDEEGKRLISVDEYRAMTTA